MIEFNFESDESVMQGLVIISHFQQRGYPLSLIGIDKRKGYDIISWGKEYIDRLDSFIGEVVDSPEQHVKSAIIHADYTKRIVSAMIGRLEKCYKQTT